LQEVLHQRGRLSHLMFVSPVVVPRLWRTARSLKPAIQLPLFACQSILVFPPAVGFRIHHPLRVARRFNKSPFFEDITSPASGLRNQTRVRRCCRARLNHRRPSLMRHFRFQPRPHDRPAVAKHPGLNWRAAFGRILSRPAGRPAHNRQATSADCDQRPAHSQPLGWTSAPSGGHTGPNEPSFPLEAAKSLVDEKDPADTARLPHQNR